MVMVDRGMGIRQLFAPGEIESVEQRLGVLVRQTYVQVVSSESSAHGHREGSIVAVPVDFDLSGRDVVGLFALALNARVLQPTIGTGSNFGDRIGPITHAGSQCHVTLYDGGTRISLEHDQITGMADGTIGLGGRDVKKMHRNRGLDSCRNMDYPAIAEKSRIERGERAFLDEGIASEVSGEEIASVAESAGQVGDLHATGKGANPRQLRRILPV